MVLNSYGSKMFSQRKFLKIYKEKDENTTSHKRETQLNTYQEKCIALNAYQNERALMKLYYPRN